MKGEGHVSENLVPLDGSGLAECTLNHVKMMVREGFSGLKRLMLGSVAMSVLHDSPVPVTLIRPEACRL